MLTTFSNSTCKQSAICSAHRDLCFVDVRGIRIYRDTTIIHHSIIMLHCCTHRYPTICDVLYTDILWRFLHRPCRLRDVSPPSVRDCLMQGFEEVWDSQRGALREARDSDFQILRIEHQLNVGKALQQFRASSDQGTQMM